MESKSLGNLATISAMPLPFCCQVETFWHDSPTTGKRTLPRVIAWTLVAVLRLQAIAPGPGKCAGTQLEFGPQPYVATALPYCGLRRAMRAGSGADTPVTQLVGPGPLPWPPLGVSQKAIPRSPGRHA